MAEITVFGLDLTDASMTVNLPFSGRSVDRQFGAHDHEDGADDEDSDEEWEARRSDTDSSNEEESSGRNGKVFGVIGVFVFLVIAAAVVKYLSGDDEPETETVSTEDEPVGVAVSTNDT